MPKLRADQLLVDRGLAESRARAQALILAGLVFSGERKLDKAGQALAEDAPLEVRGREHPWVSRGGIKLAHALDHFAWDVRGAVALDVGASTGGFTDVLLQRGAAKIFAVDVGTNQLAWKLRQDPRVVVHERTNARYLTSEIIPEPVDLIVCDASFISLAKVLDRALDFATADGRLIALVKPQFEAGRDEIVTDPIDLIVADASFISLAKVLDTALGFARPGGRLIALVKPQFEAERDEVGKGGVVRDPAVHERVCAQVAEWLGSRGWQVIGMTPSPIKGPEGNVEFLIAATTPDPDGGVGPRPGDTN